MRATVKRRFRGAMVEIHVDGKDVPELVARIETLVAKLSARDIARVSGMPIKFERLFSEEVSGD